VFFLLFKLRSKEKSLRVIFLYIVYCSINEFLTIYFHANYPEKLFILFSVFTIIEFSFFCLFYFYITLNKKIKILILPVWLLFLLFAGFDFFIVNKMNDFDSIASGVESILIILMCIYYLVGQIKGSNNLLVYSTTSFWIIITFLIYLCGTFFLYIMAENMINNDRAFRYQYLIINSAFNILKNILLSVALLMKPSLEPNQILKNDDRDDLLSFKLKN
jgi:hypothetical protein